MKKGETASGIDVAMVVFARCLVLPPTAANEKVTSTKPTPHDSAQLHQFEQQMQFFTRLLMEHTPGNQNHPIKKEMQ